MNNSTKDLNIFILRGAQVQENPLALYTRLTRGKGNGMFEYFYK